MVIRSSKHDIGDTRYCSHSHPDCEIIYVQKGAAAFSFFDRQCILREKQLLLITALEEHAVTVLQSPYERYCLGISGEDIKNDMQDPTLYSIFFAHVKNAYFLFDFTEDPITPESILHRIHKEYTDRPAYYEESIRALLRLLVVDMYRNHPLHFRSRQPLAEPMLRVQRYLETHYRQNLTLEELAAQIYVSPGYLSHAFKKYSGYSPKQYLTLKRLQESKRLLLTTDLPIKTVAAESGFSDVNLFIRSFKGRFGLTPLAFRQTYIERE